MQRSIVVDTADGYPNLVTFHQPDLEKKLREKVQKSKYVDLYDEHEFISSKESNEKIDVLSRSCV